MELNHLIFIEKLSKEKHLIMPLASLLLTAVVSAQTAYTTLPNDPIMKPSPSLEQGFYSKMVSFQGMPILASSKVDDKALRKIVETFSKMLAKAPRTVMESLVAAGCHYSIIGEKEGQTDLPEYANLRKDPNMDWNKRARGLGGKYTSGGEENILELPSDRYRGESIYIHEFAHTLDEFGFSRVDRTWKNTYAMTNEAEYWAEGVQDYFDCNMKAVPSNGIHNEVCNREQLKWYDAKLFALIDRSFGENPWRYEGKYCRTNDPKK
jgi:alpha-glucosidase